MVSARAAAGHHVSVGSNALLHPLVARRVEGGALGRVAHRAVAGEADLAGPGATKRRAASGSGIMSRRRYSSTTAAGVANSVAGAVMRSSRARAVPDCRRVSRSCRQTMLSSSTVACCLHPRRHRGSPLRAAAPAQEICHAPLAVPIRSHLGRRALLCATSRWPARQRAAARRRADQDRPGHRAVGPVGARRRSDHARPAARHRRDQRQGRRCSAAASSSWCGATTRPTPPRA